MVMQKVTAVAMAAVEEELPMLAVEAVMVVMADKLVELVVELEQVSRG